MELDRKSPTLDTRDHPLSPPHGPLDQTNHAAAREVKRAEYEARTSVRKCLGCESEFRSEGIHNRLCRRCQSRR